MNPTQENLRAQYDALRQGVGLLDFSDAGKLHVSGKNAVQFLNGLVSNDVKTLAAGDGVLVAFPTLQGKLSALARIYNTGTHLLLEVDAINREKVFKNLSRFVPAGDFFITDQSDQTALLSLQGPRAAELLAAATDQPLNFQPYKISERTFTRGARTHVFIAAHSRCGREGFDLFIPAEAAADVHAFLLERGARFGAVAVGREAFEIARIEAGVPREGVDAGEEYIILESNLDDAISYTKGCYLGQEVIARIHWRGQPAKRLRGLLLDVQTEPEPGAELWITDEQGTHKKVGALTSVTRSLALDQFIALGYVHRYHVAPGTEFTLKSGDAEVGRARLTELPFVA